uniref:Uncharacterized protein n=1 Tax=Arundo donax TaxID=35708 RepID=A0A0A9HAT7_ARUDO
MQKIINFRDDNSCKYQLKRKISVCISHK